MNTMVYIASTATLDDEKKFADLYKTVPKYRQAKIDHYSDWKEKKLSLGVGLLLSMALKKAGINENKLELCHDENGKPYFKNRKEIHFSLSHSEERVMCIISDEPVGCDVEYLPGNTETDLDSWTKMESFCKATDSNMLDLMKGIVTFKGYNFREIKEDADYLFVTCSKNPIEDNQIEIIREF